jgi:uncharacterized membrane protein
MARSSQKTARLISSQIALFSRFTGKGTGMTDRYVNGLTLLAALGCGLFAGVFFAFSSSIMTALGRLPPNQGISAMQAINIAVINPVFLGVFLGTGVLCASLLYIIGSLIVTFAANVPLNDALAAADPASPEGADLWSRYLANWTLWNHLRCAASLASLAAFIMALWG